MASSFSTTAKDAMLDAITVDLMSLHNGDPGAAGTANEISGGGYTRQAATFAASSSGVRTLSSAVAFIGPASASVTWAGFWTNAGTVFRGRAPITAGDAAFNASGQYTITTATTLSITDPA